jgi:hypothetical protein
MIYSLLSISVDTLFLFYWLIKNTLFGTYHIYCYLTGNDNNTLTIEKRELEQIKQKMDNQERMLKELTEKMKNGNDENNENNENDRKMIVN